MDTLERTAGDIPKKYEAPVLEWAAKYQQLLAATWERLNAGEDIRELVIVANEALTTTCTGVAEANFLSVPESRSRAW